MAALETYRNQPPVLPDIPLTVISGALADFGMSERIRAAANAAHAYRARQSPRGRHVLAERSGHGLILSEPALVAEEIARLLGVADARG